MKTKTMSLTIKVFSCSLVIALFFISPPPFLVLRKISPVIFIINSYTFSGLSKFFITKYIILVWGWLLDSTWLFWHSSFSLYSSYILFQWCINFDYLLTLYGPLCCFQFGAIKNKCAINMNVEKSLTQRISACKTMNS